ncbi:hypothetical protein BD414DRAFT_577179 [Trametes punicea]|nr:hypothetical protein BD414DRAFT_577179 [Trametes punicea]
MASSSTSQCANMIQFPRLPSVPESWDNTTYKPLSLPSRPCPPRDRRTLKLSKSSESLTQRKDRIEFLRRREWTRRVTSHGDQPSSIPKRMRTYSWEDIIAAADAAADSWDYSSSAAAASARRPDTIDELEESDEPYVIYTASPRPLAPSAYTPHTPGVTVFYSTSPSPSPTLSPLPSPSLVHDLSLAMPSLTSQGAAPCYPKSAWRRPHSRHSSLSSISEEDEGLARF